MTLAVTVWVLRLAVTVWVLRLAGRCHSVGAATRCGGADLNNVLEVLAATVGDYDLAAFCVDTDVTLRASLVVFEVGLDLNMLRCKW